MADIVDLVSSSPPRAPSSYQPTTASNAIKPIVLGTVLQSINSSDFGDEDLDILLDSNLGRKMKARLSQGSPKKKPAPRIIPSLASPIGSDDFRDSGVFDDSVLDNLGEDEFPIDRPAKRRRTGSDLLTNIVSTMEHPVEAEAVFELSSEPDHDKRILERSVSNPLAANVLDLTDHEFELPSFSSSAPPRDTRIVEKTRESSVIELLSDDVPFEDPVESSSQPIKSTKPQLLSERTASLLANIKSLGKHISITKPTSVRQSGRYTSSKKAKTQTGKAEDDDNIVDSSQPAIRSKSPTKPVETASTKSKNVTDKEADKEKKRLEKETAKEQKRLEKEQKAAEKQLAADKAEANRKKTDKKKSSEEMIIGMPYSIKGKSIGNQVEELMKQVGVETRYYRLDVDMTGDDSTPMMMGTVIKLYRKVKSRYNEQLEEYETCPLKIEQEKHILIYLTAEEFCAIAAAGPAGTTAARNGEESALEHKMKKNLDTYITLLRSRHSGVTIVLLLQGLSAYLKKSANAKNREYAAAVRSLKPEAEPSSSVTTARPSKKRKQATVQLDLSFLTTDHIDDLTLHLQVSHQPLHIHHTTSVASSAQQISAFTQHLSTRPYRLTEQAHNLAHASFCMASGQFRTGQGDVTETFLKMLEQVNRVTPSMALGIVNEGYGTPKQLVAGFQKIESAAIAGGRSLAGITREEREGKEKARLMLQDVRKAVNKDGGYSDRRLGPAASKRIYRVFMSKDENLRDGIV